MVHGDDVAMADSESTIKVLIADEQSLFREAVRVVLEGEEDIEVIGEARDGLQAVAEAQRTSPDIAIVDAELPNADGFRATGLIRATVPGCRVLVLSGVEEERTLIAAFEAGASGYLSKASPLVHLIQATRAIYNGETLVPPQMLGTLIDRLTRRRADQDEALRRASRLTRREKEVLALLAEGADNDAIAQALVISPQTARTHIQNVLSKLGVHSRLEAAAFVRQNGIVEDLVPAER
jgi:DNA-binding NarL/FixJ family response regulator